MSVLILAESAKGKIKKSSYELAYYGHQLAKKSGTQCIALVIGNVGDAAELGKYGADKVLNLAQDINFDSQVFTSIISEVAGEQSCDTVVVSHSSTGKSLIGRLAIRMNAGVVSGANALAEVEDGFVVTKGVYSGKALASIKISTVNKVISLMGNSVKPAEVGNVATVEAINVSVPNSAINVLETKTSDGKVPLPEAELVVSAGRGMKDPTNWGIIDELADELGATTACSRPVADTGWRPHHEHVGQTGVAIRPNLYIAIGISGAIQHLAGVNSSKTIVVINKDPEAPFFKAADYGVLGDLFEVVPKLTAAVKNFNANK